jgi:hypothetical protein
VLAQPLQHLRAAGAGGDRRGGHGLAELTVSV